MASMTDQGFHKVDGRLVLPLEGRRITRVLIDFRCVFEFWIAGDDAASVTIERPFVVKSRSADVIITPENTTELAAILPLLGQVMSSAFAAADGALECNFEDGTQVSVRPDPDFEAWQVSLEGGAMVVSMPGGRLAVYPPR